MDVKIVDIKKQILYFILENTPVSNILLKEKLRRIVINLGSGK